MMPSVGAGRAIASVDSVSMPLLNVICPNKPAVNVPEMLAIGAPADEVVVTDGRSGDVRVSMDKASGLSQGFLRHWEFAYCWFDYLSITMSEQKLL